MKLSNPALFPCEIYGSLTLKILPLTGRQKISLGDTAPNIDLPSDLTAVALDIREMDGRRRNFNLTLYIDSVSLLEGEEIKCDNTILRKEAKDDSLNGKLNP